MSRYENTIWCDGCGVEITWAPVMQHNHEFCCEDCLQGRLCNCGERMEMEDDRRAGGSLAGGPTASIDG